MCEQGPKARLIGMLALSVTTALALAPVGAQAAGDAWSAPVNDATGKPVPIVLPATRAGFVHAGPGPDVQALTPVVRQITSAPASSQSVVLGKAAPSALPGVRTTAAAVAEGRSGQTGVPVGVTGLPQIPVGDVLVITARAPAPQAAPLTRRDLDALNEHVKGMLTPAGHTVVSYTSHSITVSDTPAGERGVEGYLARINSRPALYGYQVRYHVQVPSSDVTSVTTKPKPPYLLQPGETLSHALAQYVALHGWKLVWGIKNDYVLSDPFPIPGKDDLISGVSYVVKAYQAQGGLLGDAPVFAMPNHVVVIKPMTVSMEQAR